MATLSAYIRKETDKNNESLVVIQYAHLYEKTRIKNDIKVDPKYIGITFDGETELWKFISTRTLKPFERRKLIEANNKIREIQNDINKTTTSLRLKNLPLTVTHFEKEYLKDNTPVTDKTLSALDWYEKFIKEKEGEIGDGINSYRSTFEHFKSFTTGKGVVGLDQLNRDFAEGFRKHLKEKGVKGSTIHKQFKNLRTLLNWIEDDEENEESKKIKIPKAIRKINVKGRYGDPIGLSVEQFFQFFRLNLSARPELEQTRDGFIFGVSIGGPRHGDLKRLSELLRKHGFNLNQNTITYFENKTGNAHQEIQVNKFGLHILEKLKFQFPYVPSNQRMNTNLKTIAKLLEWDEIKYIPDYDDYGKLIGVKPFALKEIFSTKFMRKTAATLDNYLGISTKTSMQRTGHKTFAAFSRYVDVNKESMDNANAKWNEIFEKYSLSGQNLEPVSSRNEKLGTFIR